MKTNTRKPIIAVDIDDVIIETARLLTDRYNEQYGTGVALKDFYGDDLKLWKAPDHDTLIHRFNSYFETDEYQNSSPAQETIDALRRLNERFELHIVTGRPDHYEAATLRYLERHAPDLFKTVIFSNMFKLSNSKNPTRGKGEICVEIGASYLIDDHIKHIESAAAAGVTGLLFGDFPWSHGKELPPDAVRVADWAAVLEYFDGRD